MGSIFFIGWKSTAIRRNVSLLFYFPQVNCNETTRDTSLAYNSWLETLYNYRKRHCTFTRARNLSHARVVKIQKLFFPLSHDEPTFNWPLLLAPVLCLLFFHPAHITIRAGSVKFYASEKGNNSAALARVSRPFYFAHCGSFSRKANYPSPTRRRHKCIYLQKFTRASVEKKKIYIYIYIYT